MMQLPRLLLPYPNTTSSSRQPSIPIALYQPSSVLPIIHHPIPAQFSALASIAPTDEDERTYGQLLREQEEKEQLVLQQTQVEQSHKQEMDLHRHRLRQEKLLAKQQQQQQRHRERSLQRKQHKKKKQKNRDGREETTTPSAATQPVLTHMAGPAWSGLVQQMNGSTSTRASTSDLHTEQREKQQLWSKPQRYLAPSRTKYRSKRHMMMDNDDDDDSNHSDRASPTQNASFSETDSLTSKLFHTDKQQQPEEKQAQDEATSNEQVPTTMLSTLDTDSDDVEGDVSIPVSSGGVEADESSGMSERRSVHSGDDRAAVLPLPDTMFVDDDYPVVHGNPNPSHRWSHPSAYTAAVQNAHHRRRAHQRHPVTEQDEPPVVRQVWSALPVLQSKNAAAPEQPSSIWSQPIHRSNHYRDQIPIVADTSSSSSNLPLLHIPFSLLSTQPISAVLHPLPVHPLKHSSHKPPFHPLQSNQTSIPYHDSDTEEDSVVSTIDFDNLVQPQPSSPPSKPPVYDAEDSAGVGIRLIDIPCVSEKWNKLWQMSEAWIQAEQSKEIAQAAKEMTKQVQQQLQDTLTTNQHRAQTSSSSPVSAVASAPAGSTAAAPTSVAPLGIASAGLPPTTAAAPEVTAPATDRVVDAASSTVSDKLASRPDLLQQAREANQVAAQLKQSIKEREDTQMHKQAQSMLPTSSSVATASTLEHKVLPIVSRPGVPPTVIGTRTHTLLYIDPLAMLQGQQQPPINKPRSVPSVGVGSSPVEETKERQQWMQDRLKQLEQQLGFPLPKPTVLEMTPDKLGRTASATTTPGISATTTATSRNTTAAAVTSSTVPTPAMAVMSEVPFQRLQQDMQVLDQELAQLEAMSRRIQQSLNPTTIISAQQTTSTSQTAPPIEQQQPPRPSLPPQQQQQLQQQEEAHAQSILSRLHAEVEKTKSAAASAVIVTSSGAGSNGNNTKSRTLTFADLVQENQLLQKKSGGNNRGAGLTARGIKGRPSEIPTHTLHRALTPVPIPPTAASSSPSPAGDSPSVTRRLSALQNSKNSKKSSTSSSTTSTPRRASKSRTTTAAAAGLAPINEEVLFAQAQALIEQFRNEFNTALSESSAVQLQSIRA